MAVVEFFSTLHETGHGVVERDERFDAAPLEDAIRATDADWRLELAYEPPALVMPVAVWAVSLAYRAAQLLVYRDIDAKTVERDLAKPAPAKPSADACYSADLGLRVLPDLIRLARALADDDPLVTGLMKIARAWPLSSVGVAGVSDVDVDPFIDHPSLRRLYADRIVERRDASRLGAPRVRAAVREAIGAHDELVTSSFLACLNA